METRLRGRLRTMPLTVVHRCGHLQAYVVPGWLTEDARWRVASQLSTDCCLRCVLDGAWKQLPLSRIGLSPAA